MKFWKKILWPLIILIMVVTGCSAGNQGSRQAQQTPVVRGDITTQISGSGKVAVVKYANLSFGINNQGKLTMLNVSEGDTVKQGEVLAQLDTSGLEVSLSQARVSLNQAELAQSQAQVTLEQAKLAQMQDNTSLTTAKFYLYQVQPVSDMEDTITKLQQQIDTAKANARQAAAMGDTGSANAALQYAAELQVQIQKVQMQLANLLTGPEYTGLNQMTYNILGQTYDRLTVENARMREQAVETAQAAVEMSANEIAVAQKALDQSAQGIALAQQNIEYNQDQIDNATIRAPFDGTVATLFYHQGDNIPVSAYAPQIIMYLVDTHDLEVDAYINELDAPEVQVGQSAEISIDALPGAEIQGKVTEVAPIPNAQAAAAGATMYVAKVDFSVLEGLAIKAGMNARVEIPVQEAKGVLLVPTGAIRQGLEGKSYVQVMNNQHITNVPVVTGAANDNQTEIVSGLKEGDKVITGVSWSLGDK